MRNYSSNNLLKIKVPLHARKNSSYSSSTNYNTINSDNKNSIADSLKLFIDNSETVKFIEEPKNKFKIKRFNRDTLFKSIYHENKFNIGKEKKKLNKSSQKYFDYDILQDKNKNYNNICKN